MKNPSSLTCIAAKHREKPELTASTRICPVQEGSAAPSSAKMCVHDQCLEQDII